MATCWFHPEEEATVGKLLEYFKSHRGATVGIEYADGEAYRCKFFSSYDADNEDELDDGVEAEPVDYFAIALEPIEVIQAGSHGGEPGCYIELSYRDFPKRIVADNGTVVYNS